MARDGACPVRAARRQGAFAHGRGRGRPSLTGRGLRHAERGDVLRDPRRDLGGIRQIAGALADGGADEDQAVDDGGGLGVAGSSSVSQLLEAKKTSCRCSSIAAEDHTLPQPVGVRSQ